MKKTALKCRTWRKKFRSLREKFFTHQFLALSKTAVWTKTTLFSFRSSLLFSTKITPIFFTRFISRFKNHSNKIDLKKGLLQYSSSSRKKRQRPNTIQILWIVKNQDKANNSPSYRCAATKKKTPAFFEMQRILTVLFRCTRKCSHILERSRYRNVIS